MAQDIYQRVDDAIDTKVGEVAYQASCFRNGPWGEAS